SRCAPELEWIQFPRIPAISRLKAARRMALRKVQVVLRESPSALACSSSVRNPATSSLILEDCRSLLGRSTMRPAPVLPCSSSPPTPSCQGQKTDATQDQARKASADDGAGHLAEYRDAADTRRAGIDTVLDAGERHENIAVERIYRDRMRTGG